MSTADLAALLADPVRVRDLPSSDIPAALARLSALQSQLTARLLEQTEVQPETHAGESDDWITIAEAARVIHRSTKWFYRRSEDLPFVKRISPKSLLVSRAGLDRWIQKQKA